MESLSRYLVLGGIILILVGGAIYVAGRLGLTLGGLPGDIRIEGRGGSLYFPVVTSIVISILLTVILNVILRLILK